MSLPSFSLEGKVSIITGARRGIGAALALAFAEAGSDVAVCDFVVDDGLLAAVAKDIQKFGRRALVVKTDVTREDDVENLVKKVVDEFGRVDILVNNAGIAPLNKTFDVTVEEWDRVIDTDLKSVFLVTKAVAKVMVKQKKGKIINMGSIYGMMATNVSIHYCAAKAGIAQMTKAFALEWARFNINVNCIVPGQFATELTRRQQDEEAHRKFLEFKIPFKRFGQPEELVGPALLLASQASDYMTGAIVVVDGGYSIW
jgi:NAD(P)-dependent dehydrogenase (short-subunit alcohol dehydrogenase family)